MSYTLKKTLYEGYDTLIYKAYRNKDNKPVIIKVLKDKNPSEQQITKLKYEYEMVKNLDLNGVIDCYEYILYDGVPAIVFEDFNADSISNILKTSRLDLKSFLINAIKITEIVSEIHDKNLIHKDIKPQNIIVNAETGMIKLIDFGVSYLLSASENEIPNLINNSLIGTLSYISPEQTGRTDYKIDTRSDLYSLGITFYEMLSGKLPFDTKDPMRLIHCHLAGSPKPPKDFMTDIPAIISDIIMKLISKNPDDRYQSAQGLKKDLEECLLQLENTGNIKYFELCKFDIFNNIKTDNTFYGRVGELNQLKDSFLSVKNNKNNKVVFIEGYHGSGKSLLIDRFSETYINHSEIYLLNGTYDEYETNISAKGIFRALDKLFKYILSQSLEHIELWKNNLNKALGDDISLLINVLPSLQDLFKDTKKSSITKEILYKLKEPLINFINLFSEKPLIIILDNIQYIDPFSISIIESVQENCVNNNILVIGVYTSNNLGKEHYIINQAKYFAEHFGNNFTKISMEGLDQDTIYEMLKSFKTKNQDKNQLLSKIIKEKTNGNPLYVKEFIKNTVNKKLINYDWKQEEWNINLEKIKQEEISENKADLLITRICDISSLTVDFLKCASCFVKSFDPCIIPIIQSKTIDTDSIIHEMLSTNYLLACDPDGSLFKFSHDKLKSAFYDKLNEEEKNQYHYKIVKYYLANLDEEQIEDKMPDIVEHLNKTDSFINDNELVDKLIDLNYKITEQSDNNSKTKADISYSLKFFDLIESKGKTGKLYKENKDLIKFNQKVDNDTNKYTYTFNTINSNNNDILDLSTFMKLTQTISSEIVLKDLLKKLVEIVIESAGAERGIIIIKRKDGFTIEAEGNVNKKNVKIHRSIPYEKSELVPQSAINYVKNTGRELLMHNAFENNLYNGDEYLIKNKVKSLFVLPLEIKGEIIGILYLENNKIKRAFTSQKVDYMKLLSTQIAVSLNNALLYNEVRIQKVAIEVYTQQLEKLVSTRTKELDRANQNLLEAKKLADNANLNKSKYLANMSHELRTPLNSINGIAEGLLFGSYDCYFDIEEEIEKTITMLTTSHKEGKVNKEKYDYSVEKLNNILTSMEEENPKKIIVNSSFNTIKEMLPEKLASDIKLNINNIISYIDKEESSIIGAYKDIIESCKYLLGLINTVLDLSKAESGKIEVQKSKVQIREFMRLIMTNIDNYKKGKHKNDIDILLKIDENIPEYIEIDKQLTQQVILNLSSNAVKYSNKGEVVIKINAVNGMINFSIKDCGMGIKETEKTKIFTQFGRTEDVKKNKIEGTGLGLAYSKKLIEIQGGNIGFESEYGKGSTFWFSLPIK